MHIFLHSYFWDFLGLFNFLLKNDNSFVGTKNSFNPNNLQLNEEVEAFVNKYIDSFVTWDLIVFFNHNPNVFDTSNNIARKIGRNEEEVSAALEELKNKNVLNLLNKTPRIYTFEPSNEIKQMIGKFVELLKDPVARLQIVSLVLKQATKKQT